MPSITYQGEEGYVVFDIGYVAQVHFDPGDIHLVRAVAHECPLAVGILIRRTGEVDLWYTQFAEYYNTYWQFAPDYKPGPTLSRAQQKTLYEMETARCVLPGHLSGELGTPVKLWARLE